MLWRILHTSFVIFDSLRSDLLNMTETRKLYLEHLIEGLQEFNETSWFCQAVDSVIEMAISEDIELSLPLNSPRSDYWDENAQIQLGDSVPAHVDPLNYPYYSLQTIKAKKACRQLF